jgi:glycerol-3-phosphate dehydrogenase (NAD(P)+)
VPRIPAALWVRSPELAASIARTRENGTYLPGIRLPDGLTATSSLEEALRGAGVVFMAVPSHGFRSVLEQCNPSPRGRGHHQPGQGDRDREQPADVRGRHPGPPRHPGRGPDRSEPGPGGGEGQPAASVVALPDEALARRVQDLVHTRTFRVYMGTDVVGCEIAGATKNVMAIAAGICDGLGFGENTRAVLITRGLAELGRLGRRPGGQGAHLRRPGRRR